MNRLMIAVASICIGLPSANADNSVITDGKALNDENCVRCHGSELYTRPDKRVASRKKLSTQVRFCKDQLQLPWFDEEVESVAEYLNKEHYHFK
ncbi:MAG: cytochrome c [Gammaproteobacteria bacterium]|nr:cytochrome c [Gammaproteobacteria bacterium]